MEEIQRQLDQAGRSLRNALESHPSPTTHESVRPEGVIPHEGAKEIERRKRQIDAALKKAAIKAGA